MKIIGEKVIGILKAMNKEEFRKLRRAFQSPYFVTNARLLSLYDYLKKYYPDFPEKKLQKEKLFKKLYPGNPFNANLLRVLMREFTEVVEKFLITERVLQDAYLAKKFLKEEYGDRNLYPYFQKTTEVLLNWLDEAPYRGKEYFEERADLNFAYYFHPLTNKHTLNEERLLSIMDSIDKRFALAKFRVASEIKNRERVLSKRYDIQFLTDIFEYEKAGYLNGNAVSRLYKLLFQLLESQKDDSVFQNLKKQFSKDIEQLQAFDQSLIMTPMINYAVRQINIGDTKFYAEALDLYKIGLENDLVIDNERIDEAVFGNIVTLGCHANEFEWTNQFIHSYQKYLKESIRVDVVALNLGLWYFYQNDFDNARHQFLNHPFSHYYQPKARVNLIRSLFEQFLIDDTLFELLMSHIVSFEKFLHRSEVISSYRKEANLNFVLIIKRIVNGISQKKELITLHQSLQKQLQKKERITAKDWLVKKINQLV